MTISLASYLKTISLAALFVLPTLANPVDYADKNQLPGGGAANEMVDALGGQSAGAASAGQSTGASTSASGKRDSFEVGDDITVTVGQDIGAATNQISDAAVNTTLTALYKAIIEPANAKLDPLQGPLNVTLEVGTAGIIPTDFSSWGSEAPPPSFALLQYRTVGQIVQGLQTYLAGHPQLGQGVKFTVTRYVVGGGSDGKPAGAAVAKGFVSPVAGK